jgi:hypothetical protein
MTARLAHPESQGSIAWMAVTIAVAMILSVALLIVATHDRPIEAPTRLTQPPAEGVVLPQPAPAPIVEPQPGFAPR